MSTSTDAQRKILSRTRSLVERGERVSAGDIAALFTVSDTNALARIARIARERRFGHTAFHTDALRIELRDESVEEIVARAAGAASVLLAPVGEKISPHHVVDVARALGRTAETVLATTAARVDRAASSLGIGYADVLNHLRSGSALMVAPDGAELFDDELRAALAPRAVPARVWLDVHREAHRLEVPTVAAMTYLTQERPEAYAAHLDAIRTLQDETRGFAGFVPLPVHNRHRDASYLATPSAHQTLRAVAISRIALDNVEHIGLAPALVGAEVAFVALSYGADTIDTTIRAGIVETLERDAPAPLDLPVMGDTTSTPARVPKSELVISRLVEARYVPQALHASYAPRTSATPAPSL